MAPRLAPSEETAATASRPQFDLEGGTAAQQPVDWQKPWDAPWATSSYSPFAGSNGQEPAAANFADFLLKLATVKKGQSGDYDGLGKSLLGAKGATKGALKL